MFNRDISEDIANGRFVSHQPLIVLTILWRYLTNSPKYRSFISYFKEYFSSGGSFSAGLFRFCYFCMFYFPIAAQCFYSTMAYLTGDSTLYITISFVLVLLLGIAIAASSQERNLSYTGRLYYAWALSLATIFSTFLVSFFSKAAVDYHSEIWLYMVLTGFTIVTTFKLGLISALLCAAMPFALEWKHTDTVTIGAALQGFGLFGTYFLASICKMVSDTYAIKAERNEGIAVKGREEISFLLNSLPQGVIQLDADLNISTKTSSHTKHVLDKEDIVGKGFKEIVLDHCRNSVDDLDQCYQALFSIMDADELNFEANADKLLGELHYGKKILKITWNPHFDKSGDCESMLVTLLDISKEKAHEAEIKTQQDQMRTVFELLSIGNPDRVQKFLSELEFFQNDISQSIEADNYLSEGAGILMKLHTFKGVARTLGLDGLSSEIHLAEDAFSMQIQKAEIDRMSRDLCIQAVKRLKEKTSNYKSCFTSTFKQQSIYSFSSNLGRFSLNKQDSEELLNVMEAALGERERIEVGNFIERKNKTMLKEFLAEQYDTIKTIAKKLNKEPPLYDIQVEQVALTHNCMEVLEATLGHLFNNHVDHGIEDRAERVRLSKNPRGKIVLRSWVEDEQIHFKIFDDGRGLDIISIAEKARLPTGIERQTLVEAVFTPGVSTARCLTEVSGRGIGMGAIRSELEKVGGRISIQLVGPTKGDFQKIAFLISLPSNLESQKGAA